MVTNSTAHHVDVLIIGDGISGIGAARLRGGPVEGKADLTRANVLTGRHAQ